METDRFRDYGTDPVGPYLSINMDHEVLEDGKVLSFEAHVTVLGELTFVVNIFSLFLKKPLAFGCVSYVVNIFMFSKVKTNTK